MHDNIWVHAQSLLKFEVWVAPPALRCYTARMKTLLIIVVLGAGVWFLMMRAKQNAAVQQMADAPLQYTKALQNDTARAKAVADAATKLIQQQSREVQKTVESQ